VDPHGTGGVIEVKSEASRAIPDYEDLSFVLASRRTGLSFQRTRMSADRTLVSVIRTSFALIG
jgi:putative membrane protein